MSRPLFEIGADYDRLRDLIDAADDGELTPEAEAAFDALAAGLATEEGAKLDAAVGFLRQCEMEAFAAREEAGRWAKKAQGRERAADRVKRAVLEHLQRTGRARVATPGGHAVAVQVNSTRRVQWGEPTKAAAEQYPHLVRVVEVVEVHDKAAVVDALKAGEVLPFATLEPAGVHLRVR